jgi:hypothetical protein
MHLAHAHLHALHALQALHMRACTPTPRTPSRSGNLNDSLLDGEEAGYVYRYNYNGVGGCLCRGWHLHHTR